LALFWVRLGAGRRALRTRAGGARLALRRPEWSVSQPFLSAEDALANINDISEHIMGESLKKFLEMNLPEVKSGKKAKYQLGVIEPKIGTAIQDELGIPCVSNETILEIVRGVRAHLDRYIKGLEGGAMSKAQLGLAHSYSRAKVKFNVNRSDNMIIQAICLLDQLDKDLNTMCMRIREWYSWHFPELGKIVKDNYMFAHLAKLIGDRATLNEESLGTITAVTMDEPMARQILDAARASMGMDMSEVDRVHVDSFADRVVSLARYRKDLHGYLVSKMSSVAPSLASLIGEMVGARLISHAGSLTNLAKCPASTVQILGAEKALFRALKTKGNTPKYGIIFHSSFIGRAGAKNKGRISRYLANKCTMAARIDSFSDVPTPAYGEKLHEQVEERLRFFETGAAPTRNIDAMKAVAETLGRSPSSSSRNKKRSADDVEAEEAGSAAATIEEPSAKKVKKDKKEKKEKKSKKEKA
jgi:nucleolar protein 56